MADVDGSIGQGTVFTWKGTTIPQVVAYRGPKKEQNRVNGTNCDSAGWEEKITGVKKSTILTITAILPKDDSGNIANIDDVLNDDGTAGAWTLTFATGWAFSGNGIIGFEPFGGAEEREDVTMTIETTGAWTVTPPA